MKKLGNYIICITLIAIVLFYCFEYIFTNAYYKGTPRSKVSWVKSKSFPDSLDYVLLGSSRCIHHIQPKIIKELTHKEGINLGYASAGPVEIKLLVNEVLKQTEVKKIFIQIGPKHNNLKPDKLAITWWLPFLKEENIYKELRKHDSKYFYLKNIPFYRYQLSAPKIGLRNIGLIALNKQPKFISNKGYVAIHHTLEKEIQFNETVLDKENPIIQEIITTCKNHDIELFFFTAPVYKSNVDFSVLKKHLPNYTDFSDTVENRNFFADVNHLNHEGATLFTNIFLNTYFLSSSN